MHHALLHRSEREPLLLQRNRSFHSIRVGKDIDKKRVAEVEVVEVVELP